MNYFKFNKVNTPPFRRIDMAQKKGARNFFRAPESWRLPTLPHRMQYHRHGRA